MRRFLKGVAWLLLIAVLAIAALLGYGWWSSEAGMARVYRVADPALTLPDDPDALDHGRHLFQTRGCGDCHGADGVGHLVLDAGPLMRLVAPNITPAKLAARGYDPDRIAAAIRHGVRANGTPLIFMPAGDWHELGDADTAALVAHLRSLPDSDNDPGPIELRPLSRVLYSFGQFPLLPAEHLDHTPRQRGAPPVAVTAEYGRYVASMCTGCHQADFAGSKPLAPGTPAIANITPAALGNWSEDDFLQAMRSGKRPDGSDIDRFMPWQTFAQMTETELRAIWSFLRSVPAVESRHE
jgi:mono/diheme cytochrome c family protein